MALRFFEGFDAYGTPAQAFQQSGMTGGGGGSLNIATTNTRTGRAALNVTFSDWLRIGFSLTGTTLIIGMGIRWSGVSGGLNRPIRSYATATSRSGIGFACNASGNLVVGYGGPTGSTYSNSSFGTTLWTGTDIEPTGVYVHYELKAELSGTATGSWTLRRNGQVVQSQSGVITLANAADVITAMICEAGGSNFNIDDIYICDGSGSDNNDFLGPVRDNRSLPTANDSVAWTPNTGANWNAVNDTTPNDDTTYTSAATLLADRFVMADPPASAAIMRGLKVQARMRKEDASTVEVRLFVRSGGITAYGPVHALDTNYAYYSAYFPTDPATGVSWTRSAIIASKPGYERVT